MKGLSKFGRYQYFNLFSKMDKEALYGLLADKIKAKKAFERIDFSEECVRIFIELLVLSAKEDVPLEVEQLPRLHGLWKSVIAVLPESRRISGTPYWAESEYQCLERAVFHCEHFLNLSDFIAKLNVEISLALYRITHVERPIHRGYYLHTSKPREMFESTFPEGESLNKL